MGLLLNIFLGLLPVVLIITLYAYSSSSLIKKSNSNRYMVLFGLGMVSALVALGVEALCIRYIPVPDQVVGTIIIAFIFVAGIEELFRFIFFMVAYRQKIWFDRPLCFITAGLLISMGFATLENLSYAYLYDSTTMVARIFTAVPAHATFGIIMGYYFYRFHKFPAPKYLIMSIIMPIFIHGLYDFFVIQLLSESLLPLSLVILIASILWSIYIIRNLEYQIFNTAPSSLDAAISLEEKIID